ncbi:MAG: GNAT family N-acetyltransferase [Leptolyngbya sp. SIO1E4]|nr:GNAT family N-acetyltransferase [Leptolyngbya sp. SIO1E4]
MESIDTLVHLWAETFTQAYDTIHSPENIRAYCAKNYSKKDAIAVLSSNQFDCTLAYRENLPVGYYILKHQPCPTQLDGDSYELKQIYILSSEYGTGLGRTLFKHAFEVTRQANCRWIWLCVSDSNYRAQKFYKKLKFEPIAPGPFLEVGTDKLASTIMVLHIGEA